MAINSQIFGSVTSSIPSPSQGVWELGPIPIRAYAMFILLGIVVAVWITNKRYIARGGKSGQILDIAIWAVPFGIVGARIYHVVTDWQLYFAAGGSGITGALKLWQGGLGIWGAVAGGAIGAWIAARRQGLLLPPIGDALAPALAVAQAIGRWGNYFNQELFGRPTDVPWALEISVANRPVDFAQFATFHPTFLYESLWCLLVALLVWQADRRFRMGHGRVFALYVALYCLGRVFIESVRIDSANTIAGLRLNVWTSILIGLAAVVYIIVSAKLRPGRETTLSRTTDAQAVADPAKEGEPKPEAGRRTSQESTANVRQADGSNPLPSVDAPDVTQSPGDATQPPTST